MLQPCDILLTRHQEEARNRSPGYWNHAAIYIGKSIIVEAQEGKGVITCPVDTFWNRYAEIVVLRWLSNEKNKQIPIAAAAVLVGTSYRKVASLFQYMRGSSRGENCVSVVRKSFMTALGYDPGWKKPDDIIQNNILFYVVGFKS